MSGAKFESSAWMLSLGAINIGCLEIGDEKGNTVATLESRRYRGRLDKMFDNARLIAASPKLLGIAERWLKENESAYLDYKIIPHEHMTAEQSFFIHDYETARSDIAKAKTKGDLS